MITNQEILNRFDVLYNNIMSNQAPGLDGYEKSVFWNKATLEVLKNHLNPKGNKYGEGFDGSSKRQIDFSNLTVENTYNLYPQKESSKFLSNGCAITTVVIKEIQEADYDGEIKTKKIGEKVHVSIDGSKILSILNESVEVYNKDLLDDYLFQVDLQSFGAVTALDINKDGVVSIADSSALIDYFAKYEIFKDDQTAIDEALQTMVSVLLDHKPRTIVINNPIPIDVIRERQNISGKFLTVVPISHVEYDTLASRPYRYPPKSQAWRMFVNGGIDIVVGPNEIPIQYRIRYVRMPAEVDLTSDVTSEAPEILYDEILQRAVELAKNSWEGNIETTKTFGERSE